MVSVVLLLCLASFSAGYLPTYLRDHYRPAKARELADAIRTAQTAQQELSAFRRASQWKGWPGGWTRPLFHLDTSYWVHFYDGNGDEISPHKDGRYDLVREVEVVWNDGISARRCLLSKDNLITLMGE